MITVGNIYDKINEIAPFSFQDKFDNSGLLVGSKKNEVKKVLVCLDITKEIALEASEKKVDLVISHHPVIFNPLYSIDNHNPAIILASNNISAICAHTNLDMSRGGINDIIATMFDATIVKDVIEISKTQKYYQLNVYVPNENVDDVYNAMCSRGAGKLGDYQQCCFLTNGEGRFMPLDGANPYCGEINTLQKEKETKIEMIVPFEKRYDVVSAMLEAHPYEKPAYSIFENNAIVEEYGYGKIMRLKNPMEVDEFAKLVKKTFNCNFMRYNNTGNSIETFGFSSGSGGSLISKAIALGADAFVCGDIKHDQFIDAQNAGMSVFDAGHYDTEKIVIPYLISKVYEISKDLEVTIPDNERNIVNCL